jgi:nucleoside-diphosphate-sugar epimerase
MSTVLVNGASSTLGRRIVDLLGSDPDVAAVVAVEADHLDVVPAGLEVVRRRELAGGGWASSLVGPFDLVVLAPTSGPDRDGSSVGGVDLDTATALLEAASGLDVRSVVVLSSAMVYGAWRDNPVPITETAVLRPNPGCRYAADKAELERLALDWADRSGAPVAVLRPALTVSADAAGVEWMESSLWHAPTARHGEADPPGQFLLTEDLARAVEHARRGRLGGPYNVAPDGWLAVDRQVELSGRSGRLRIPAPIVDAVATLRWTWRLTSTPPDVVPYTMHSWVVANDRLCATGWRPTSSNDETFVAANREGWWASLNARHRQDVALGGLLGSTGALVGGLTWWARSRRRRRRASIG